MNLRLLDMDSMYILRYLYLGMKQSEVAKKMGLSQAAITTRIYRIEDALNVVIMVRERHQRHLNTFGRAIGSIADANLKALEDLMLGIHPGE